MYQEKETKGKLACKCKQWVIILNSTLLRKLPFPSCHIMSCVRAGRVVNNPRERLAVFRSCLHLQNTHPGSKLKLRWRGQ